MNIIYGKSIADSKLAYLKAEIARTGVVPGLAVILVGNDRASKIYVSLKEKKAREVGMNFSLYHFVANSTEDEIISKIQELNRNESISGIIVQVPLPRGLDTQRIINSIEIQKDVDGFHPESISKFRNEKSSLWPVFPKAIVTLIDSVKDHSLKEKAVVIVNSQKFGEVMNVALHKKGIAAEYILPGELLKMTEKILKADIVITAIGEPKSIRADMIKSGAIVIDGGITERDGQVLGDVDFESLRNMEGYVSPVPGGVGPVTIACLLENTYLAYKNQSLQ